MNNDLATTATDAVELVLQYSRWRGTNSAKISRALLEIPIEEATKKLLPLVQAAGFDSVEIRKTNLETNNLIESTVSPFLLIYKRGFDVEATHWLEKIMTRIIGEGRRRGEKHTTPMVCHAIIKERERRVSFL